MCLYASETPFLAFLRIYVSMCLNKDNKIKFGKIDEIRGKQFLIFNLWQQKT